jgi:fatty-acid desaturase
MYSSEQIHKKIEGNLKIAFVISIFSYLCLIYSLFVISFAEIWKVLAVYYIVGCSEQIFHHRKFAHKAWVGPRWLDVLGLWIANQSMLSTSIFFAAQHRLHHKFADTKFDPHSPIFFNKWRIQFLYPWHRYDLKYVVDLMKDKMHSRISEYHLHIMLTTWILIIGITSFNWWLTIWMPGIALVVLIKNFLNTQLHGNRYSLGNYRNVEYNDESNNNWIWGYLAFDGWHQNHHVNQTDWYMGRRWWEIDIPGIIIGILSILTLNFDNFKKYRLK